MSLFAQPKSKRRKSVEISPRLVQGEFCICREQTLSEAFVFSRQSSYGYGVSSKAVWFQHPDSYAHTLSQQPNVSREIAARTDEPGFEIGSHPESPVRLRTIEAEMQRHAWFGWERVQPELASLDTLKLVHTSAYLESLERFCATGGGMLNYDTYAVPASWQAARRSAGGACELVDWLCNGKASIGFSALRPPGHHATADIAQGFCLINNIAVAAAHARTMHGLQRVAIVDFDVHHGNGTSEIFYSDPSVLFISIHEMPLYPGTGTTDETGTGAGEGYNINLPVEAGSGDDVYNGLFKSVITPTVMQYAPQLILVSAGFDAHHLDPLASCEVSEAGFADMAQALKEMSNQLNAPLGFILEGGYSPPALARSVCAVVERLNEI